MFPIIIMAFVPIRLFVMNKLWARSTLRYVEAWACRPGRPEDEKDGGNATELGVRNEVGGQRKRPAIRELNEKPLKEAV